MAFHAHRSRGLGFTGTSLAFFGFLVASAMNNRAAAWLFGAAIVLLILRALMGVLSFFGRRR